MEKHPQADPSQKSPVSKVLPPAPPEEANKANSNGVTHESTPDKKLESSPTLASKTYQETKPETSADAKTLESADVASKNGQISGSQTDADKSLPHPIISVDIQKSMPYENKQVVPEESTKSEPDVKPEVVASVVTTAVVKEATLAINETESSVLNGSKVTSDSSKVDAIVEQELAKISDSGSGKTELKTTVVSDGESKPLLNGDIDHSPISETIISDSSKDDKCPKDAGFKTSTNQEVGKDDEVANSDVSSCNGVPGIITVETITKKDNSNTSENNLQTELTNSDAKQTAEKDLKSSGDIKDSPNNRDSKEGEKCEKAEKDIDDCKMAQESSTEKTNVSVRDENLTDSAKLLKENGDSGGKTQNKIESNASTGKSNLPNEDAKTDNVKDEKEFTETSKPCEPMTEQGAKDTTITSEKVCDETENKDSKKPGSDPAKSPSKDLSSKTEKESETEKSNAKDSENVVSESTTDNSETLSKGIKGVSDEKPESKSSECAAVDDKSKSDSSPARKESPNLQPSKEEQDKRIDVKPEEISKVEETAEVEYDMTALMTSQILTPEMLNGTEDDQPVKDVSASDSKDEKDTSKTEDKVLTKAEDSSRISASRRSPETCDVGVGLDERKMARVAASDGAEEEVDGQQATTEVEVTEESLASHPDEADSENLVPSGAHSPTSVSPSSDRSQSSTKVSPTPASKPSSAISSKNEESKPASAVSRSSIPDPIVYEPPERRKSATSTSSDEKKDTELDKSQKDEKESEKSSEAQKVAEQEAQEPVEVTTENVDQSKEGTKTNDVQVCPEKGSSAEEKANTSEDDTKGESKPTEKEKGEDDAKEKEAISNKSGENVETEETAAEKSEDAAKSKAAKDEQNEKTDERADTPGTNAQEEEPDKEKKEEADTAQETDAKKESETDAKPETESVETASAAEEKESKEADETKADGDVSEVKPDEVKEEKEEDVKDDKDEKSKLDDEAQKLTDEPTTLVEEDSKAESSEKEATGPEEKEEDEAEEKKEDKGDAEEGEIVREDETQKEAENEAIEETETVKIEEQEEQKEPEETEEKADEVEAATEEEPKEEDKEEEKDVEKEEAKEEETAEGKEPEPTDEPEKQDDEKGEESEDKPESPPKSPTKRMRSPDKSGRRGVSPISSPPKPLKTPPSPQKPQKSTSPKKKNGMLSPIKTPKTPGSDGRKLPPIKAPVGLAPNPNLKNIRSKIGSFDNIRYKPGGGDKKVISSKKLEWKAAPKIGSLDHSLKGEKKHSKSFSKGESKEGKLVDGQSPLPSGDEGEQDGAAAATESLIKTESGPSTEMPAAIAAES
ncbi:calponin homology domain-containing protein DDB_G0272472-like [Uloborus diversus]|uniref:calponin homology domain-containing protein DDB_G0272472-like n=1 Tax=Uloborus diversus TaxID=327109 RepID=UPI0024098746|nr:calponin homology domain-containing protein DDB_G0272472-like [Uloborus diversus]